MMLQTLLAAAAAAAATTPQPAELKVFGDWTVGCDNGRACHAVALVPEDWPDDALTMSVRRGAAPEAPPTIGFELGEESGATALAADGERLPLRLVVADMMAAVGPGDARAVLGALRSGQRIEVLATDGRSLGKVSLNGATAALLYMDDQQKRIGTVTALVRAGPRPASSVPPAPPLPMVRGAPPPGKSGPTLSEGRIRALRNQAGCTIDEVGGPDEHEIAPMDPGHSLLLLACGSGAYNVSYVPFVVAAAPGGPAAKIAAFDANEDWWREEGKPILINAGWDAERRRLVSFSKGRGLGDCGTSREYAWDGTRFRLVEQAEMGECRGSADHITTWRAGVVQP
jgi:uncharacterized protein DUF1176